VTGRHVAHILTDYVEQPLALGRLQVACADADVIEHEVVAELLPWPVNRKRLGTLRYISRIRDWLQQHQPDLLHVHSRLPALLCWRALRGLPAAQRTPWVTTVHGHYSVSRYSSVMTRGDRVIAVSEAIRNYTRHNYQVPDERLRVIHGGIDHGIFAHGYRPGTDWYQSVHAEYPELHGRRWLCLPGRLSRYKGHAGFINLLAALRSEHRDLQGLIIGGGRAGSRYRDELEGLAAKHGVLQRLTFIGERDDIREWLAASELVLSLCSDPPEAFGRTVLEALSLGRPVLGWNHGGVAEILAQMFPQGAVTPGDTVELRARASSFLQQPPAVSPNTAFSLQDSLAQTLALYEEVIMEQKEAHRA
jgi:glycosyltransferase involved in cell wall biosynthesis